MDGMELSRHFQSPCPALPPADCGKTRVEVSSTGADVGRPRTIGSSPLSMIPSEDSRQDQHEAQSMWLRVTSISRRGFARIYEFLTRSTKARPKLHLHCDAESSPPSQFSPFFLQHVSEAFHPSIPIPAGTRGSAV